MADPILEKLQRAGSRKVAEVAYEGEQFFVRSLSGELRAEFFQQARDGKGPPDYWLAAAGLCGSAGEDFMAGKTLAQRVAAVKDLDGELLLALAREVLKVSGLNPEADKDAEGN